jgi:hypothetical protein
VSYLLDWARTDGTSGRETPMDSQDGALDAARSIEGVAIVTTLPTGPYWVFREGIELSGDDATAAMDELHP